MPPLSKLSFELIEVGLQELEAPTNKDRLRRSEACEGLGSVHKLGHLGFWEVEACALIRRAKAFNRPTEKIGTMKRGTDNVRITTIADKQILVPIRDIVLVLPPTLFGSLESRLSRWLHPLTLSMSR